MCARSDSSANAPAAPTAGCAHLHLHTEYSLLDGGCQIKQLPERLQELGFGACGISDHGEMGGVKDFWKVLKEQGIKPILGCEIYLCDDRWSLERATKTWHLGLIATNAAGYRNLSIITSRAHIDSQKVMPGGRYVGVADWQLLAEHAEGLVCLSGCMAAPVMNEIMKTGSLSQAGVYLDRLIETFGAENVYGEIQDAGVEVEIPADSEIGQLLVAERGRTVLHHPDGADGAADAGYVICSQADGNWVLVEKLCKPRQLPYVATGDVHYLRPEDAEPHDVMICIGTGQKVRGMTRRFSLLPERYYMRSEAEMREVFADYPEAVDRTMEIVERCSDAEIIETGLSMVPPFSIPEGFDSSADYLRHLVDEGLVWRYGADRSAWPAELPERVAFELDTIINMGYADFFLVLWDWMNWCRERDIPLGPGRGSAAGAVVAYSLGITALCPLKYGLLFERFLNPDRVSMPDIDVDIAQGDLQTPRAYVRDRYNAEASAREGVAVDSAVTQIGTLGTYKPKAAIKAAARGLNPCYRDGMTPDEAALAVKDSMRLGDKLSNMIPKGVKLPSGAKMTLDNCLAELPELEKAYRNEPMAREVIDQAKWLESKVSNFGVHAAAVVIGDRPLETVMPLRRASPKDPIVTSFEQDHVEDIGALKQDFLGLRNLDVIWDVMKMLKAVEGIEITDPWDERQIPIDDVKAYELFSRGDTVGLFQVESAGMRSALRAIRPSTLDDIIAIVALYRPGPLEYIPVYARRKAGLESVPVRDERLRDILGPTYGLCLTGDSRLFHVRSGEAVRLDDRDRILGMLVQGIDEQGLPATGRVTHWAHTGRKPVYRVRLRNGMEVAGTAEHPLWTENGWRTIGELRTGQRVGVPRHLAGPMGRSRFLTREQARLIGLLLGDGCLGRRTDFTVSDLGLLEDFVQAAESFPDTEAVVELPSGRNTWRIRLRKPTDSASPRIARTGLDRWLSDIGMHRVGSAQKQLPQIVFRLGEDEICEVLSALWDTDGCISGQRAIYSTTSKQLASEIQLLLLRVGIRSTITAQAYRNERRPDQTAYQITTCDMDLFVHRIGIHMMTPKCARLRPSMSSPSMSRAHALSLIERLGLSRTQLHEAGFDRQHWGFLDKRESIKARSVETLVANFDCPDLEAAAMTDWQEVITVEPEGVQDVYDITVDGIHSFVANGVIVHNCVYQEQNMLIARKLAGFTPGQADDLRKAIGKKLMDKMLKLKRPFLEGCSENGVDPKLAQDLWDDNERAGDYSFNRSHAACYGLITYVTAWMKANYPAAYMAANMTSVMSKVDKLAPLLNECKRMHLRVLAPDVNRSLKGFSIHRHDERHVAEHGPYEILFGMTAIRGIGGPIVGEIRAEREARGPFRSIYDLMRRMPQLDKSQLDALVKAGALDCTGASRRSMSAIIGPTKDRFKKEQDAKQREFVKQLRDSYAIASPDSTVTLDLFGGEGVVGGAGARKLTAAEKKACETLGKLYFKTTGTVDADAGRQTVLDGLISARRTELRKQVKTTRGLTERVDIEEAVDELLNLELENLEAEATQFAPQLMATAEAMLAKQAESMDLESALASVTKEDPPLSDEDWPLQERLNYEHQAIGIYASGHPLDETRAQWARYVSVGLGELRGEHIGRKVTLCGVITNVVQKLTRRGSYMYIVDIDDPTGSQTFRCFEDIFADGTDEFLQKGQIITAKARVQEDTFTRNQSEDEEEAVDEDAEKAIELLAFEVRGWQHDLMPDGPIRVQVPQHISRDEFAHLRQVVHDHTGADVPVVFVRHTGEEREMGSIRVSTQALRDLRAAVGSNKAVS